MLTYRRFDQLEVVGYSDWDYTGCVDTRNSTFCYLFLLDYGSRICGFLWGHNSWFMAVEFYFETSIVDTISKLLKIYYDNSVTVFFSKNDKYSKGEKYMEIKYLNVKKEVQKQRMSIEHISTKLMIADPLTKRLASNIFREYVERMGIMRRFD